MMRCSCSNFNIPGWRWLPACRPYCLTAKQVAPNHESIRDDGRGRSAGLEVLARPLGLEFLCPFSNFKMHKAHSVWAGGRSMCVWERVRVPSRVRRPNLRLGRLKKKSSFLSRLRGSFFRCLSPGNRAWEIFTSEATLLLFIAVNRGRASGTGKKY